AGKAVKVTLGSVVRSVLQILNNISKILFVPVMILSILLFIGNPTVFNGAIAVLYLSMFWYKVLHLFVRPSIRGIIDSPNAIIEVTKKDGTPIEVTKSDSQGNYKLYTREREYSLRVI